MRINLFPMGRAEFQREIPSDGQVRSDIWSVLFNLFAQIIPAGKFNPSKFFCLFHFVSLEEVPTQAENLRE